jgi:hypothetical protein
VHGTRWWLNNFVFFSSTMLYALHTLAAYSLLLYVNTPSNSILYKCLVFASRVTHSDVQLISEGSSTDYFWTVGKPNHQKEMAEKDVAIAYLLWFFLGYLGIHR